MEFLNSFKADSWEITEVVSGGCRGPDSYGEIWAKEKGIPVKRFPAEWERYGKKAGFLRNVDMAKYAEALIAFWDDESKGTLHMIKEAHSRGLKVITVGL